MILDAENRVFLVPHSFYRLIVEIDVRDFHGRRQRSRVDRKAMVLRGYRDLTAFQVFDRLIASAVSELKFELFSSICQAEQLVSKTDAKNRAPAKEFL